MNKILLVNKPIGMTPLEVIHTVRNKFDTFTNEKISYVGRLDPMAHGLLLLAIGDAIKHREELLHLKKAYTFTVLFGVQSDTYDILGIIKDGKQTTEDNVNKIVTTFVSTHLGKQIQSFPPYSSRTVGGKPLFQWAREGKISEIEIPVKEIEIEDFSIQSIDKIPSKQLKKRIEKMIESVTGDFRQKEVRSSWEKVFAKYTDQVFTLVTCTVTCSSGTYVRSIANQMGEEVGCGAIALDIKRTRVGEYLLEDAIEIID